MEHGIGLKCLKYTSTLELVTWLQGLLSEMFEATPGPYRHISSHV